MVMTGWWLLFYPDWCHHSCHYSDYQLIFALLHTATLEYYCYINCNYHICYYCYCYCYCYHRSDYYCYCYQGYHYFLGWEGTEELWLPELTKKKYRIASPSTQKMMCFFFSLLWPLTMICSAVAHSRTETPASTMPPYASREWQAQSSNDWWSNTIQFVGPRHDTLQPPAQCNEEHFS